MVEPTGEWGEVKPSEHDNKGKGGQSRAAYDHDSDDDIVEIVDNSRTEKIKHEAATPAYLQHTPPLSSREASIATNATNRPPTNGNNPTKRSSNIIDLTLSDDDEPPRPAKRQNTSQSASYHTPSSLPDVRNTDVASRLPTFYQQVNQSRPDMNRPDMNRPDMNRPAEMIRPEIGRADTLPPIQPGVPNNNGGLVNGGQRLPWHFGPSSMFNQWRDPNSQSYSP
jgi:E3 SUMO-protein ligase PIAS1